jgi:hypothetical protein
MNMVPVNPTNEAKGQLVVQFLRGGASPYGSRDEILNNSTVKPATIGNIGPGATDEQKYSYFYQDDAPQPGDPPQVRTDDDSSPPAGYAHKLGDIFHSEPFLVEPPRYFQYLSANLTPRTSSSTTGEPYLTFAQRNAKRRKVIVVGSNDGFLHAFDSGVFGRDTTNFPGNFDLGTGREIFAYAPKIVMADKFPSLLNFQPQPQYFVDGSPTSADVFIDPEFVATPDPTERVWRTVVVGGLRQGGTGYYALDVTQPDDIDTNTASATYGEIVGSKDASPGCLDGGAASCTAGAAGSRQYPAVLWEMTDTGSLCTDSCPQTSVPAPIGETWSRPVVGRIKVHDALSTTADASGFDDRYVAIFGGGFDPTFTPGDNVALRLPKGRTFYIVDVETGKILYKTTQGTDAGGTARNFAPMPSAPAVADFNDDGYLDVAYIGDVNGQMWRINLTPDGTTIGEIQPDGQAHGYQPFLLFDGCEPGGGGVCNQNQPIFYEPGIVFVGGAATTPRSRYRVRHGQPGRARQGQRGAGRVLLRQRHRRYGHDVHHDGPPRSDAADRNAVRDSVHRRRLRERRQRVPPHVRDAEREDDLHGLLDPGLSLAGHVHAGLGVAVRDQRQLVPVPVLLPDRTGRLRDHGHLRGLRAGPRQGNGVRDAIHVATRRYNRHRALLRRRHPSRTRRPGSVRTLEQNWKEQQ